MAGLLERLNAIASDRQTYGKHDSQLALAALVLLDKNNVIQFDADDLDGTMLRLSNAMSFKFAFSEQVATPTDYFVTELKASRESPTMVRVSCACDPAVN